MNASEKASDNNIKFLLVIRKVCIKGRKQGAGDLGAFQAEYIAHLF